MFKEREWGQIIISDIGIFLWIAGVIGASYVYGVWNVFVLYGVPYLWYVPPEFSLNLLV